MDAPPKRQSLPTGLWIVATPIGNLEEMTPRGRQALIEAGVILCEDTRRTQTLLQALEMTRKRLVRFDEEVEHRKLEEIVKLIQNTLQKKQSVALCSDAGVPGISDPGQVLVNRARTEGWTVVPVGGVSALSTLVSVSGFQARSVQFRGFFPRKESDRAREWTFAESLLRGTDGPAMIVWFESPRRVLDVLRGIEAQISSDLNGVHLIVAKEMTKIFERYFYGSISEVSDSVAVEIEKNGDRGEWCFAVGWPAGENSTRHSRSSSNLLEDEALNSHLRKTLSCLIDCQIPPSEAAKRVSQSFGIPKRTVYEWIVELKKEKKN